MPKTEEDLKRNIGEWKSAYEQQFGEPLPDLDLTIVLQDRLAKIKQMFFSSRIDHVQAPDVLTALKILRPDVKGTDIPSDLYDPEREPKRSNPVGKRPAKGKALSV